MYSIKPGRGPSFMGGVGSLIAAVFGIIWTVMAFAITRDSPFPVVGWAFPLFGIIFVIAGLVGAAYNFFNATTAKRLSALDITTPGEEPDALNEYFGHSENEIPTEKRLKEIDDLKKKGLITEAEYTEQRHRILSEM